MKPTHVTSANAAPGHDIDRCCYDLVSAPLRAHSDLKIPTKRIKSGSTGFKIGARRISKTLIAWMRPVVFFICVKKAVAAPNASQTTIRILMRECVAIKMITHPPGEVSHIGGL